MVTSPRTKFIIPPAYVVLDILGVVLVGLGSASILGKTVLPKIFLSFAYTGWLLMGAGLCCMLPLIIFIFKAVRHSKKEDAVWYNQIPPQFKAKLEAKINELRK